MSGYDRSLYPHWKVDGQDTRETILIERSMVPAVINEKTGKVFSGLWVCMYTGFVSRDPKEFDLDHAIALGEIHRIGGETMLRSKRKEIANDPSNLIIVKAGSNRSKSDSNAFQWVPPNLYCWEKYIRAREAVRAKYDLAYEPGTQDAMDFFLMVHSKHSQGIKLNRVRTWMGKHFNWFYSPL